jgi:hypothetical protein
MCRLPCGAGPRSFLAPAKTAAIWYTILLSASRLGSHIHATGRTRQVFPGNSAREYPPIDPRNLETHGNFVAWASRPLSRERPAPARARAGCPRISGRDAHATSGRATLLGSRLLLLCRTPHGQSVIVCKHEPVYIYEWPVDQAVYCSLRTNRANSSPHRFGCESHYWDAPRADRPKWFPFLTAGARR